LTVVTVLSVPFDILVTETPPGVGFETLITATWLLAIHTHQNDSSKPNAFVIGPLLFGTAATLTIVKAVKDIRGHSPQKTQTIFSTTKSDGIFPM